MNRINKGVMATVAAAAAVLLAACGGGDDASLPSAESMCGSMGVSPLVLNGASCAQPERAAVVLLNVVSASGVAVCSGTMIAPTKILTAAHCISADTRRVVAGVWSADGTVTGKVASRWAVHPQFQRTASVLLNDVAVVVMPSAMPNPSMSVLVSAPTSAGQGVYLAGWGAPGYDLAVGFTTLISVNENSLRYQYSSKLSNACPGDSGGPVYRMVSGRAAVVGITSTGAATCGDQGDWLSTNVQSPTVINFIRSQVPEAAYL
jgi:secreted trypsin-like serine protease